MDQDRLIGLLGLLLAVAGILLSLGMQHVATWGVFLAGASLFVYALWRIYYLPDASLVELIFRYDFQDPEGRLVLATRTAEYVVRGKSVTTLWARNLTSTGDLRNFRTNEGELTVEEATGGGVDVRVDFFRPLTPGRKYLWVVSYECVDSFTKERESACYTAVGLSKWGGLEVRFHPDGVPSEVRRVLHRKGQELGFEGDDFAQPTQDSPLVRWRFRTKRRGYYCIQWKP